jgi:hypothetical protein
MIIDPNFKVRSDSLLGRQHFQNAYVTTDMGRATAVLGEAYGIEEFYYIRDFPFSTGGVIDVAVAWTGNVNIEIIHGRGNRGSIYEKCLPETGFALKFHHFGYMIPDRASWESLTATIAQEKREIVFSGSTPDVEWIYIDAPELGHYLEYVFPGDTWITLFDSIPHY